jgi:aspartyl-tRNA(Asn)/glutamyl-tRNA(Gln) amidotransferase subunit C
MKVTEDDVRYVAALANLELTDDENRRMVEDLNSILDYVDRLNKLDTSGISPGGQVAERFAGPGSERAGPTSELREDQLYGLRPSLPQTDALVNAPKSDGTFFLVPKVIER